MIKHDLDWTLHMLPGHTATVQALADNNRKLRAALAAVLRAGDRAARGAQLVSVHGQAVVVVGAEQWQELRRAQVAAGDQLIGEQGPMN